MTDPLVPDLVEIAVPRNGKVVVVSDLHLSDAVTEASAGCTNALMDVLKEWDGAGVLIIAGDGFELLFGVDPKIGPILDAHAEFCACVKSFASGRDRHVVVLSGNHDGQIAWDPDLVAALRDRLGATEVAIATDLVFDTAAGEERVHVVHGNQDDPYNRFLDTRSPIDTPFGHHVVREVLPQLEHAAHPGGLLEGLPWLNEPTQLSEMVASRLLYRKIVWRLWWLAVPFLAAILLRLATFSPGANRLLRHHAERWLYLLGFTLLVVAVLTALAAAVTMLRVHHALVDAAITKRAGPGGHNAAAREEAARWITKGYAGMVSGHTHSPELSVVGSGFYANSGCGVIILGPQRARLGLPSPFEEVRRCSRVELAAHEVLEVRLAVSDVPLRSSSRLERMVTKKRPEQSDVPVVVAALPAGPEWPFDDERLGTWKKRRQVRRLAAGLLLAAGILDLVTALLPTLGARLGRLNDVIPLHVPRAAGVLAICAGVALVGLARPVRRGYRPAYLATLAVLGVTTLSLILRDLNIEQAVLTGALALWLAAEHRHFRVDPQGRQRFALWAGTLALGAIVLAASLAVAFNGSARLARDAIALVIAITVLIAVVVSRPARARRRHGEAHVEAMKKAREIVATYGGDTLDYFALRDDKIFFFTGGGLVTYTVLDRTMLVSPDPICPPTERTDAWADAMDLADSNGWNISVLAANATWLPVYHAAGLQDIYMGDEAIVDCRTFSLQGKAMKSLRGAHNRMSKNGYRVQMCDPCSVDAELRDALLALMTETRQGEAERGFSMTLGRVFDPEDKGLLLAVCLDADGKPKAFNQYIPANAIGGYSLDLMRRTSDPDAPNGLTDFVIIETIAWMREKGMRGLGLNFAVMRAVLAGEEGTGPWRTIERRTLHHYSDTMQIESLWKFNQKYDPLWRPRYVVTDAVLNRPRAGIAIARAESVFELPVIGKLLEARTTEAQPELTGAGRPPTS